MNTEELKKHIEKMDVKSDEFWELYKFTQDKYRDFTIQNDVDSWQKSVMIINEWLDKSVNNFEEQVILIARMIEEVFMMRAKNQSACTGTLQFSDETFHFDIYTKETEMDKLNSAIIKAGKSMENNNNFEIKKSKFGKNYFKKETK